MANTKDIRAKISSTIKTQQTTKAMKMVSAAKLRKAQQNIVNARPYAGRIYSVIRRLAQTQGIDHSLLRIPEARGRMLTVVLTSDRGLCGGFNSNIIKYTKSFYKNNKEKYGKIDFLFIGRRGADYFRKTGIEPVDIILNLANEIKYPLAASVSDRLWKAYLDGHYQEVRLIYNEFKSALSQKVIDERLLPVEAEAEVQLTTKGHVEESNSDFLFEPPAEEILDQLLTKHFAIQVYRCMQESVASEHGARMAAMENATKNAGEMIKNLTLKYNKIRQSAITTELIEITSGAEALRG